MFNDYPRKKKQPITCRYCGAVIEFARRQNGTSVPVDPDLIDYDDADPGDRLIREDGRSVLKQGNEPPNPGRYRYQVNHFVHCPKAPERK